MARDTFPYWPPTSPQRPANIAGRQTLYQLLDLPVNQIPAGRGDEIPLRPKPLPKIRPPELPVDPEAESSGHIAQAANLYTLFYLTEVMDRATAANAFMRIQNG